MKLEEFEELVLTQKHYDIRLSLLNVEILYIFKVPWFCVSSTQETDVCLISCTICVQIEEPMTLNSDKDHKILKMHKRQIINLIKTGKSFIC